MEEQKQEQVVCNACITGISWGKAESGGLVHKIALEGGGWRADFCVFLLKGDTLAAWISNMMNMFEVDELSEAGSVGKIVRVTIKDNKVVSIGHPYKEIWLDPSKFLKQPAAPAPVPEVAQPEPKQENQEEEKKDNE